MQGWVRLENAGFGPNEACTGYGVFPAWSPQTTHLVMVALPLGARANRIALVPLNACWNYTWFASDRSG